MALTAAALDQLVHVGHSCPVMVSPRPSRRCPRHETPPFVGAYQTCALDSAPGGAVGGRGPAAVGIVQRGHYLVTLGAAKCSRAVAVRPVMSSGFQGTQCLPIGFTRR